MKEHQVIAIVLAFWICFLCIVLRNVSLKPLWLFTIPVCVILWRPKK